MTSPQEKAYLSENRQPQLYGAYISTYALAVLAVGLRLSARKYFSKAGIWLDDYAICASLACATGNFVDMITWVRRGVGRHIELYGLEGVKHFYLSLFVCEILYTLTLCLTKFSILLFLIRIFGKTSIRIPIMILASIVTGWAIAVVVTTIFQCSPVQGFWDKSTNPTCAVNVYAFFIGNAVPNIVTDWALLLLPIPYIWRLHQRRAQKIALCGVFGLGGFICIISIVRLYIMATQLFHTSSTDVTWLFIGSSTWTAVEVNIGIVSACLPSLRPLLVAILGDSAFTTSQPYDGSNKRVHDGYPSGSGHGVRTKAFQDPYMMVRGETRDGESVNVGVGDVREGSGDVLVTHDISVVGEKVGG